MPSVETQYFASKAESHIKKRGRKINSNPFFDTIFQKDTSQDAIIASLLMEYNFLHNHSRAQSLNRYIRYVSCL